LPFSFPLVTGREAPQSGVENAWLNMPPSSYGALWSHGGFARALCYSVGRDVGRAVWAFVEADHFYSGPIALGQRD